jgi:hypothetical protein
VYHGQQTGDWSRIDVRTAEQILGWAVLLMLLADDEDNPRITGALKFTERGPRATAYRTGLPPQSVRIGGTYVTYSRLEPFATTLGITKDFADALKTGDPATIVTAPIESLMAQMRDKTFLRGVSDLMEMSEPGRFTENFLKWASNFAASWIPNIVRTGGRAFDETIPERSVWKGPEYVTRVLKRAIQRTELGIITDEPKVDLWGRPIKRPGSPVPGTDIPYRMISPFRTGEIDVLAPDRVLLNWNNAHPEDERHPMPPAKTYVVRGERRFMTDEEYALFSQVAGQRAYQRALNLINSGFIQIDKPAKRDIEKLLGTLREGRKWARNQLIKGTLSLP